MEFRKADSTDIPAVMAIIGQAQAYLREHGIDQWQNHYPNAATIRRDIERKNSYVLQKDGKAVATVAVSFDGEKTYDRIYEGEWMSRGPYAVIHRIAVDDRWKGLGLFSLIVRHVEGLCRSRGVPCVRVDTHEKNRSMQSALKKNSFQYCGVICLDDGSKRIAFEKAVPDACSDDSGPPAAAGPRGDGILPGIV